MSGVFKITSKKPDPGTKNVSLGISLMNARFFSSGTFANDNGHWLVSARRGYIDVVLKMMDEKNTPSPKYYDIYAKGEYKLNDNHTFSINVLHAGDKFDFTEEDLDFENTHYNNSYIWLTLNSVMSQSMTARTVASFGEVNHLREGTGFLSQNVNDLDFRVKDDRGMKIGNINQDWIWNISKNNLLNWGFDAKFSSVQYDYSSLKVMYTLNANQQIVRVDNLNNIADKNLNNQYAVYLSNRIQITSPLTAEIGVRYDYSTLIRDGDLSPRVNIAYAIDKETFIRAGWGYFYQTQNLNELNIQDGDKRLFPAEKTENFGVGFEHYFGNGIHLRIEAYYKRLADLRPVYRNLFNPTEVFPEMNDDRVYVQLENARSKGIELFLKYDVGGKFSWWATYAYASSIERIKGISRDIPRPYDQKHTFCLDLNYRLTEDWNFSLAFQYHTGWPRTEKFYITVPLPTGGNVYTDKIGPYMGSKFPDYHRLDVRATRNFNTSIGKFSIFAELINLYSRDNIRSIEYRNPVYPPNGLAYYNTREFYWLPFLPSIGISWSLDM
jgi:outer membrane receptor for ferrienterochelin and colicin